MFSAIKKVYLKKALCLNVVIALVCIPLVSPLKAEQEHHIADALVVGTLIIGGAYTASYLHQRFANWWYYSSIKNNVSTKKEVIEEKDPIDKVPQKKSDQQSDQQKENLPPQDQQLLPAVVSAVINQLNKQQIPSTQELQQVFDWCSTNIASPKDIMAVLSNPNNQKVMYDLYSLLTSIASGNLLGIITNPSLRNYIPHIVTAVQDLMNGKSSLQNSLIIKQAMNFFKQNIHNPEDLVKLLGFQG